MSIDWVTFSSLVSGLVWSPPYGLQENGNSRTFWWKNNILFELELCTLSKKLLIKPDEEIYITETDLQELHERKLSSHAWHKWHKACTPY
jgi:hypothetical protein